MTLSPLASPDKTSGTLIFGICFFFFPSPGKSCQIDLLDVSLEDLHRFLAMLYTARFDCYDHREQILALAHLFGVPAIAEELERQKQEPQDQCQELNIPCSFCECGVRNARPWFPFFSLSLSRFSLCRFT